MSLPALLDTVTIAVGPYLDATGGAASGTVTFTPSSRLLWTATGTVVLEGPVSVTLGSLGTASVELPATDAAGLNVTGFTYTVDWNLKAGGKAVPVRSLAVALPAAAPSVTLGSLVPAETGTTVDVVLPAVLSVAGLSGTVTAAGLADELAGLLSLVTVDADGSLVVDGTTVELATDAAVTSVVAAAVAPLATSTDVTAAIAAAVATIDGGTP